MSKKHDKDFLMSRKYATFVANEYAKIIEKALDKLYCYGEIFDSKILQQFQKEMENILQGEDKDE